MDAKELIDNALRVTGLTLDQLAGELDYKSLRRARNGEIPLPDSKRKHIATIVENYELRKRTTYFVSDEEEAAEQAHFLGSSPREKLQAALREANLTPAQLGKKIGRDSGYMEGLVNGSAPIFERVAEKIAAILPGLTVEELLDGSDSPRIMDPTGFRATYGSKSTSRTVGGKRKNQFPIISWALAGSLGSVAAVDEGYGYEVVEVSVDGKGFAIPIKGDSMAPEIKPGDLAVVRTDIPARPGQLVLVKTIHGEVLCKNFTLTNGGQTAILTSVNSDYYKPIEIAVSDIAWIYPVKQVIREY